MSTREFVIATHSSLIRLRIDDEFQVVEHELVERGYHYGVAVLRSPDRPTRFVAYRGGDSVSDQSAPRLTLYERNDAGGFSAASNLEVGDIGDVHQLAYANGGLYIADTKHNTVVYHGIENDRRHRYVFSGVRRDENHVNSVYPCGDRVVVMLHNLKRKESQIAVLKHDLEAGFTFESLFSTWHHACHNVFVDGKHLLYNASMTNELIVIDLATDRIVSRLPLGDVAEWHGHAKALSVLNGNWFVGVSESVGRFERTTSRSCLAIIDAASRTVTRTVDLQLPGWATPVGNVNEIRSLDDGERAEYGSTAALAPLAGLKLGKNDYAQWLFERVKGIVLGPLLRIRRRMRVGTL